MMNFIFINKDLDESQLSKVIREKEDLQLLLNKFERHMAEVCSSLIIFLIQIFSD